jgi:hypothetical protein
MNTRSKVGIVVCIGLALVCSIYILVGIWYFNFGQNADYDEFDEDGNSYPVIITDTYDYDGDKYQEAEQRLHFVGYRPTLYPEWMESSDIIKRMWRLLGNILSPTQTFIRPFVGTPDYQISQFTLVNGERLLTK